MTRDEAIAYITAHPGQFAGVPTETVLARTQSADDPEFYDPTFFSPPEPAPAPASPPAPRPAPQPPTAKPVPAPAPTRAAIAGVPKSVIVLGTFAGLALAFHKRLARALS
jgi:hypothetical protein